MAWVQTTPVGRTGADHSSQRNRDLTVAPKAKLTTRNLSHRDYRKKKKTKNMEQNTQPLKTNSEFRT